jgi:dTDP-4-amino-4,6-dideoxygalactose transaminase
MDDAAHALGSSLRGERLPRALDAAAYSFHAVKNVTTAEGGALVFRTIPGVLDAAAVSNLKTLALHGQNKSAFAKAQGGGWEYDILMPGYKCNLTDLHAALGLAQLARYPGTLHRRCSIVARYNAAFADNPRLTIPPFADPARECAWHIYPLILADQDRAGRDRFIKEMEKKGIGVNVHFKLIPEFTAYRGLFDIREYPRARAMSEREVTLPLYPGLTDCDVERVIAAVGEAVVSLSPVR